MGNKSESKSQANTTTTTNTKNVNVQGVQGTSIFTDGQVTVTDSGAIQGSLEIGSDAVAGIARVSEMFLEAQQLVNDRALGLSEAVADGAGQYAARVSELAETAATDDTAETIQTLVKYGAGAVAVVAGAYYFSKAK